MRNKRATVEAVALIVGTVLALAGSIAFVLPAGGPGGTAETREASMLQTWTSAGGELEEEPEPDPQALRAFEQAGLTGEPTAVRFVDPERGSVARALIDAEGSVLVYEAGMQARFLHPAIGSANLQERGTYFLVRPGAPVERCKLD